MSSRTALAAIVFSLVFPLLAVAGEPALVSTMGLMPAVASADGITIAPALGVPGKIYTGDLAPSQVLEIIRPEMKAISIGRLYTSCSCVMATLEKKDFAVGERALVEIRNVKATPSSGATYAIYVQLTSPRRDMLQYDLFVKSGAAPIPAAVPVAEPALIVPSPVSAPVNPAANPAIKPPVFKYEDVTPYPSRKPPPPAKAEETK